MSDKEKIDKAVNLLLPEAQEIVDKALNGRQTTKDGYGLIMSFLSGLNDRVMAQIFLLSCIKAGYPIDTANQIKQIMGWC